MRTFIHYVIGAVAFIFIVFWELGLKNVYWGGLFSDLWRDISNAMFF